MFQSFRDALFDELVSIKSSVYKLLLLTLLPLFSFFLLVAIFYDGVLENIAVVVVDNDKSSLSRRVIHAIDDTKTLDVKYRVDDTHQALNLIKDAQAYAVIVIPKNFYTDVMLHKQPIVSALVNTQYILVGKIITAALNSAVLSSAGEVEFVQHLAEVMQPSQSIALISPVGMQITPLFNTYQNYFYFLVSALLPALWQIFIVVATVVCFGEIIKAKKEKEYFHTDTFVKILGRVAPYTFAYFLLACVYLFYIYGVKGWAFEGSMSIVLFGAFLTVVAYQGIALLFLVSGFDYARALSLGAVYSAPAFAFLGVTFPLNNMNFFAQFWREMLPISHFVELQISQANYGVNIWQDVEKLGAISLFLLSFFVVYLRFKQRVK